MGQNHGARQEDRSCRPSKFQFGGFRCLPGPGAVAPGLVPIVATRSSAPSPAEKDLDVCERRQGWSESFPTQPIQPIQGSPWSRVAGKAPQALGPAPREPQVAGVGQTQRHVALQDLRIYRGRLGVGVGVSVGMGMDGCGYGRMEGGAHGDTGEKKQEPIRQHGAWSVNLNRGFPMFPLHPHSPSWSLVVPRALPRRVQAAASLGHPASSASPSPPRQGSRDAGIRIWDSDSLCRSLLGR